MPGEQFHARTAQQRHKIIRNGVALVGEESVSGVTGGNGPRDRSENPLMRIYIIANDGITLCPEMPAAMTEGEVAVASKEELHAAPLSGKRLLAFCAVQFTAGNSCPQGGIPIPEAPPEIDDTVSDHRAIRTTPRCRKADQSHPHAPY